MRVVITGSTGFIGSNAVKVFLRQGDEVFAIVRPDSKNIANLPENKNFHIIFSELSSLKDAVNTIKTADIWLHFAWEGVNRTDIDSYDIQIKNIENSLSCIAAAKQLECRLFADAGSRAEYGSAFGVISEETECLPISNYGKAKLEFFNKASDLCHKLNLQFFHLRFFSVYGYGDHPWSLVSTLINSFSLEKDVSLGECNHKWNYMYIDDAVNAVYSLCNPVVSQRAGKTAVINIASDDTRTLHSFVDEIHKICRNKGNPVYGTFKEVSGAALSVRPDNSLLKELTDGFLPPQTSFFDGITETIKNQCKEVSR